ncbi:hypothetical protein [Streptomyces sp. H39-S7]|nr:hypothetical protein [Streptomyces sp. H39-S7]MCZ4124047.1 hypothetical protein [Streptomyces sp. H39-S7]
MSLAAGSTAVLGLFALAGAVALFCVAVVLAGSGLCTTEGAHDLHELLKY